MHSLLTNFQRSHENVNEIRNSKRDFEEFIYPFSPVRRRSTPQPPPKVEVNIEGTDTKDLTTIGSKKEIPLIAVKRVTTKKPDSRTDRKRQKMDDYHTCMDDYDDDDDYTFQGDAASDENGVQTYARPTERKHSPCNNVNCSHSQSGCDASVSSQCSTNTYGGPRTMGKVHEFYNDLQVAEDLEESASQSKSQDARDAQLKLNKWNWLLNWLDLSGDTTGKTPSRRLISNEMTKKSTAPKERKPKTQPQQQRQPPKQRTQIPAPPKEDDKGKLGQKSPSSFMKSKPKLAKNEGVDIVGLAERTKPENSGAATKTTVQKTRSCTKRRAAPRKTVARKPAIKKRTQPKLTRKFLADIRRRYAKVIYKKK